MKRNTLLKIYLLFTIFYISLFLNIQSKDLKLESYSEYLELIETDILVRKDLSLLISEKITYVVKNDYKHGIYRALPIKVLDKKLSTKMNYVYRNGEKEPYKLIKRNNYMQYKIGSENDYIETSNNYTLSYVVYGAVKRNKEHTYTLEWDVIGELWSFPIMESRVNIYFEMEDVNIDSSNIKIYSDLNSKNSKNFTYEIKNNEISQINKKELYRNRGLKFNVPFETNMVKISILDEIFRIYNTDKKLFYSLLTVLLLIVLIFLYLIALGLTMKNNRTDKSTFEEGIPKNISAMSIAYINKVYNKKIDILEVISIGIMSLISKKHIKILDNKGQYVILNSYEYLSKDEKFLKKALKRKKLLDEENILSDSEIEKELLSDENSSEIFEKSGENEIHLISNMNERILQNIKKNLAIMLNKNNREKRDGLYTLIKVSENLLYLFSFYIGVSSFISNTKIAIIVAVNLGIWLTLLFLKLIKKVEKLNIVHLAIILLFYTLYSRNILIFLIFLVFVFVNYIFLRISEGFNIYDKECKQKINCVKLYIDNSKKSARNILNEEELLSYLRKIYPYTLALRGNRKYSINNIISGFKSNEFISVEEINIYLRKTFNFNNIKFQMEKLDILINEKYKRNFNSSYSNNGYVYHDSGSSSSDSSSSGGNDSSSSSW